MLIRKRPWGDVSKKTEMFALLYEKYKCLMQRVAFNILHDPYLAEDAVHDAFVKLAGHTDGLDETESLAVKRYLITITKNAAIDIYRQRNKQIRQELYFEELGEGELPVSYMETETDNHVLNILKNLPVKYRDVFLLKYSSCMENAEIAQICGISEGTVRQRIARGKVLIETALKRLEVENGTDTGN